MSKTHPLGCLCTTFKGSIRGKRMIESDARHTLNLNGPYPGNTKMKLRDILMKSTVAICMYMHTISLHLTTTTLVQPPKLPYLTKTWQLFNLLQLLTPDIPKNHHYDTGLDKSAFIHMNFTYYTLSPQRVNINNVRL